jgi:hypothetical protein
MAGREVVDAGSEGNRREAAEHHRVDGADAGARQHREGRFRDLRTAAIFCTSRCQFAEGVDHLLVGSPVTTTILPSNGLVGMRPS